MIRLAVCIKWIVVLAHQVLYASGDTADGGQHVGLSEFFRSVDADGDGQIEPAEAMRYIGDSFGAELPEQERRLAVQQMSQNLDGSDFGVTVSKAEVEQHLRTLMKGNRVAEWVKHAVGLAQYVESFRSNSITSLDFPTMVSDDGATLEHDLGVLSKLHRQQIIRAIKRLMLGLGQAPSAPQGFHCQSVACNAVRLSWEPPGHLGHPPMHKYKLERQLQMPSSSATAATALGASSAWETAHGELDDEDVLWQDDGLQVGRYRYRLAAWNAYAWSPYAMVADCMTDNLSLPCPACVRLGNCQTSSSPATAPAAVPGAQLDSGAYQRWLVGLWSAAAGAVVGALVLLALPRSRSHMFRGARQFANKLAPSRKAPRLAAVGGLGREGAPVSRRGSLLPDMSPAERAFLLGVPAGGPAHSAKRDDEEEVTEGAGLASDPIVQSAPEPRPADHPAAHRPASLDMGHGKSWRRSDLNEDAERYAVPRLGDGMRAANSSVKSHPGYLSGYDAYARQMSHASVAPSQEDAKIQLWLRGSNSSRPRLQVEQDEPASDAEEEGIYSQDAPPTPHHVDRNRCAHVGCHRKFHRLRLTDVKHALTRHYCSVCQNVYCHQHTQFSPHGSYGSCGMESKCICETCFFQLPRATQERLQRANKLVKSGSSSNLADAKGTKSAGPSRAGSATRQRTASLTAAPQGSGPLSNGAAPLAAQAGPASRLRERAASSSSSLSAASGAPGHGLPASSSLQSSRTSVRSAQGNWALARTTLGAAYRFREAGERYRQRTSRNGH